MLSFFSDRYEYLAVYPDTEPDMTVSVTLCSIEGAVTKKGRCRGRIVFSLEGNMEYTLSFENGTAALLYLFSENDMENGILFLGSGEEVSGERCHFSPENLPLFSVSLAAFFEGNYHLFYLSSPFGKKDENRYLCHAVSRDMLSFKHLPILLEPPGELSLVRHRTGGVFGGCAVEEAGKVALYVMRKIEDKRSGDTLFSYISYMESRDFLHFSPEETVLMEEVKNAHALSDPFVFWENGIKYMLLGSTLQGAGAVLLYRETERGMGYVGPFYKNKSAHRITHPSFLRLGRTFVFICTQEGASDFGDIKSPTCYFLGSFSEGKFKIRKRGILDLGEGFYGVRTLWDGKRLLLFAASREKEGSLIIKELTYKKGQLSVNPIREIAADPETNTSG